MAILELRAARGWSLEQTAKTFLVTAETIRSWVRRIDEAGAKALVQTFQLLAAAGKGAISAAGERGGRQWLAAAERRPAGGEVAAGVGGD